MQPVDSDLGSQAKAIQQSSDRPDGEEADPRDGADHEHEECDAAEQCSDPRLAEPLDLTERRLGLHAVVGYRSRAQQ
jgi:hypothetical protein